MDRRLMVWPAAGKGDDLANALQEVADRSTTVSGGMREMIENYLAWVGFGVETLQWRLEPEALDRLLTGPRYWSIAGNPEPTAATVEAVSVETRHRKRLLEDTAEELRKAFSRLNPMNAFASLVLVDANVWIDQDTSLDRVPWFRLVNDTAGRSRAPEQDELRLVVPILLIDELDAVGHRNGADRHKAVNVARWLHQHVGDRNGHAALVATAPNSGEVKVQVVMDPLRHVRLPNNDDELLDRLVAVRDFIGHSAQNCFFLTQDVNAALRAENFGINSRLLPKPERRKK